MKTIPVVVIGHVDHGKTALVRALTGMETDRLPEEKARGVSILPGYAYAQFGDVIIDFIDAPGHENYIQAMVSGASGASAALLAISATEGLKPQTLEHLDIVKHLGIRNIIIALTKADLLNEMDIAARKTELLSALSEALPHADAPILCSSTTRFGLDDLTAALSALTPAPAPSPLAAPSAVFLPIDRVFSVEGHGAVATGTLLGGGLQVSDTLELASTGQSFALRGLQSRGQATDRATIGERVAINLRGARMIYLERGDVLHAPNAFAPSLQCDVQISLSAKARKPLKHMDKIRVLHGAANAVATLRLYNDSPINPGASGFAGLRFSAPVTLFARQHIVLRQLSPAETIGGAIILDPLAKLARGKKALRLATLQAAHSADVMQLANALSAQSNGVILLSDIARLSQTKVADIETALAGQYVELNKDEFVRAQLLDDGKKDYMDGLRAFHTDKPLKPFAPRSTLQNQRLAPQINARIEADLVATGALIQSGDGVTIPGHDPQAHLTPAQQARQSAMLQQVKDAGLQPLSPKTLLTAPDDTALFDLLVHTGSVVTLQNVSLGQTLIFHTAAIQAAKQDLARAFTGNIDFTTGDARKALGTSRKTIVPLLEHFDTLGLTQRTGNTRRML